MTARTQDDGLQTYLADRERLISLAVRIVHSRAVAEELVQESWLRWDRRSYPADKATPIFRRIVRNLAFDWLRRDNMEKSILDSIDLVYDDPRDAERVVIARQDIIRLIRALEELDPRVVKAFRMHRFEHKTMAEIAADLGTVPSNVHGYVVKALTHITAALMD